MTTIYFTYLYKIISLIFMLSVIRFVTSSWVRYRGITTTATAPLISQVAAVRKLPPRIYYSSESALKAVDLPEM